MSSLSLDELEISAEIFQISGKKRLRTAGLRNCARPLAAMKKLQIRKKPHTRQQKSGSEQLNRDTGCGDTPQ